MRILVTGTSGQLGWELMRSLQPLGQVIGTTTSQLDLADPDAIRSTLRDIKPALVVNPAAYTAVDKAESEPERAMQINGVAPGILAEEAKRLNAPLVHYSTDYVFDGKKAGVYTEIDPPDPASVYGRTKLAGEAAIRAVGCDHLVFRTSWVYASRGKNFLKTILRLAQEREFLRIVSDQIGAPTSARLIADATAQICGQTNWEQRGVEDFHSGIYNLTSTGETSWYGFACAIVDEAHVQLPGLPLKTTRIDPISTSEYPLPAPRPTNSRLDTSALRKRFGLQLPSWQAGLSLCLAEIAEPR